MRKLAAMLELYGLSFDFLLKGMPVEFTCILERQLSVAFLNLLFDRACKVYSLQTRPRL